MNMMQQERLRFIDFILDTFAIFNISMLEEYYGLSRSQCSLDMQLYLKQCPKNAIYDNSVRAYLKTDTFKRKFK